MNTRAATSTPNRAPWAQSLRASLPQPGLGRAEMHSLRSRSTGMKSLIVLTGGSGRVGTAASARAGTPRVYQRCDSYRASTIGTLSASPRQTVLVVDFGAQYAQ